MTEFVLLFRILILTARVVESPSWMHQEVLNR